MRHSHFLLHLSQEKTGIEVFWRPLLKNASALVFFSRRNDMPYRYQTNLGKLNYTFGSYKVCNFKSLLDSGKPWIMSGRSSLVDMDRINSAL